MRQVPSALAAQLSGRVTTLCHGWRVTRRDGLQFGFTDHDRDLEIDGLAFLAASGIAGSESVSVQGLAVSGAEVSGALSAATLTEADLCAGRFDGARIDHLLIDWTAPENHMLLRRATSSPARCLRLVSASDSVDLDPYAKGVWVYVPGDVPGGFATIRVTAVGAASDTDTVDVRATPGLQPLPPVQVRCIWASGTTSGLSFYALADR